MNGTSDAEKEFQLQRREDARDAALTTLLGGGTSSGGSGNTAAAQIQAYGLGAGELLAASGYPAGVRSTDTFDGGPGAPYDRQSTIYNAEAGVVGYSVKFPEIEIRPLEPLPQNGSYAAGSFVQGPYDEYGLLTNPDAAPIGNFFASPVGRGIAGVVDGMHQYKYGALETYDIEAQLAVRAGDEGALARAAIKHTVIDLLFPGSPIDVATFIAGGEVLKPVFGLASAGLARAFPRGDVPVGEFVGNVFNFAPSSGGRVGTQYQIGALDFSAGANSAPQVTLSQVRALRDMGVGQTERRAFFSGETVPFQYPTVGGHDVYGFLQFQEGTLTSQLFSINNTAGGAPAAFRQFVSGSQSLGRSLGLTEIELQGGSVINRDLATALSSRGFQPKTVPVPESLGGGTQEVLFKTVPVKKR